MKKIRIGVLGPADIAKRRMVPAIKKIEELEFAGVAVAFESERRTGSDDLRIDPRSLEKADGFVSEFGGEIFRGYRTMLDSDRIDAVYIALPPALHYRWAKQALICGKHVLLEKPFTTKLEDTEELLDLAKDKDLALAENFGFVYHDQVKKILEILKSGTLGELRLIRSNFAFPFRGGEDFRYKKALGGGALLDCGCYTLKMADLLTDGQMKIMDCRLFSKEGFDVDIYGAISAVGFDSVPIQLSFGMDQQYNCELEIWGSKGCIRSPRIYTAPAGQAVELVMTQGMERTVLVAEPDNQFRESAMMFLRMIGNDELRLSSYESIRRQSELMNVCLEEKVG